MCIPIHHTQLSAKSVSTPITCSEQNYNHVIDNYEYTVSNDLTPAAGILQVQRCAYQPQI